MLQDLDLVTIKQQPCRVFKQFAFTKWAEFKCTRCGLTSCRTSSALCMCIQHVPGSFFSLKGLGMRLDDFTPWIVLAASFCFLTLFLGSSQVCYIIHSMLVPCDFLSETIRQEMQLDAKECPGKYVCKFQYLNSKCHYY